MRLLRVSRRYAFEEGAIRIFDDNGDGLLVMLAVLTAAFRAIIVGGVARHFRQAEAVGLAEPDPTPGLSGGAVRGFSKPTYDIELAVK